MAALYQADFGSVLDAQREASKFHITIKNVLEDATDYLEKFDAAIAAGEKLFEKPDNPIYDKLFETLKEVRNAAEGSAEDRRHAQKILSEISKNIKEFKHDLTEEEIKYLEQQVSTMNGYFNTFNKNFVNFGDKIISSAENAWFAATNLLGNNPLLGFAGKFFMDIVKKKYEEKKRLQQEKERIRREINIEKHLKNIEKNLSEEKNSSERQNISNEISTNEDKNNVVNINKERLSQKEIIDNKFLEKFKEEKEEKTKISSVETAIEQSSSAIEQSSSAIEQSSSAIEQSSSAIEQSSSAIEHLAKTIEAKQEIHKTQGIDKFSKIEKEREKRLSKNHDTLINQKKKKKGSFLDGIISMIVGLFSRLGGAISSAIGALLFLPKIIMNVASSIGNAIGSLTKQIPIGSAPAGKTTPPTRKGGFIGRVGNFIGRAGKFVVGRALPLAGAGMVGWEVGKYIDEKTGIGNRIGNAVWNAFGQKEVEKRNIELQKKREQIAHEKGFSSWNELVKHNRELQSKKISTISSSNVITRNNASQSLETMKKSEIYANQIQVIAKEIDNQAQAQQNQNPVIVNAPNVVQTQQQILLPPSATNNRQDKTRHKI